MFELRTLGSPGLTRATPWGLEPCSIQPKRLAFLVYLTVSGGAVRRDTLIGLFWPELEQSRARGALRQALRYLRNTLGSDVIVTRGQDEVAVVRGAVWCDVRDFEDALATGRLEEALGLYRGDFLEGLYLTDAPEFEKWLDGEVGRLRASARAAARQLVERYESGGNIARAMKWARRAIDFAPLDEEPVRWMIRLLEAAGNAAEAVSTYEAFALRLRHELEMDPSPELRALVDDIRARHAQDEVDVPEVPALQESTGENLPREGAVTPTAEPPADGALPAQAGEAETPITSTIAGGAAAREGSSNSVTVAAVSEPAEPAQDDPLPHGAQRAPVDGIDDYGASARHRTGATIRRRPWYEGVGGYAAVLAITASAILMLGWEVWSHRATSQNGPPPTVVLPFNVEGADPSLTYLREEMVDLLVARMAGVLELPVIRSPDGAPSSIHYASADLRRPLDNTVKRPSRWGTADRLLYGEVVGSPADLAAHAWLVEGPAQQVVAVARAAGSIDQLPELADRLAAQLVAQTELKDERRFRTIASAPLPALHDFLEARKALREGHYAEALGRFREALQYDSTWALPALGVAVAGLHIPGADVRRALFLARSGRDRLSRLDQVYVDALLGETSAYMQPLHQRLATWEKIVNMAPGEADAWFWLGDILFHWGPALEVPDAASRAAAAFERAIELDPSYFAPLMHLIDLAGVRMDIHAGLNLRALYARRGTGGDMTDYLDWRMAILTGDSTGLRTVRERFGRTGAPALTRILGVSQLDAIGLDDADRAARVLRNRGALENGNWYTAYMLRHYALNRGWPAEALRLSSTIRVLRPEGLLRWQLPVLDAIFSGGDEAAADVAADQLIRTADRFAKGASEEARRVRYSALCTAGLWQIRNGDIRSASESIAVLRDSAHARREPATLTSLRTGCATVLEALLAQSQGRTESLAAVDSLARQQHVGYLAWDQPHLLNLLLARLHEARGELHEALAALRRRPYHPVHGVPYLATFLREEGRLAALVGDTAGAVRAYRHYLALRSDPDPSLRAEADSVRAQLEALESTELDHPATRAPNSRPPETSPRPPRVSR